LEKIKTRSVGLLWGTRTLNQMFLEMKTDLNNTNVALDCWRRIQGSNATNRL